MSDELGHSVLHWLPDAVWVISGDGTVQACNPMGARLLQVPDDQVLGRRAEEVLPLADSSGNSWWRTQRPLDADPRLHPRIPETDLLLGDPEGRTRPVALTAARVPDRDGGVLRLVLCVRRAERRQRLDAARSDLVSTVSHELRSPLTSVKGFTKTLLAKWDRFTDEQKRQMLATVNEDADRVTRLLGELLDVSRIDAGRLQLRRQMVSLPHVAERVAQRMAHDDVARPITLDMDPALPQVYADPDKIEQVLTNLVENSLKYGRGAIGIIGTVGTRHVCVSVADEGDGIPESMQPHLFKKFFRRTGERRSGTGLGLYISKGVVQAHGGTITVTSAPGQGSTFTFTLPLGGLELAGIDFDALHRGTL